MSQSVEPELYTLIAHARLSQEAFEKAIAGLKAEREGLHKQIRGLPQVLDDCVGLAVGRSVAEAMHAASAKASGSVESACRPVLARLEGGTQAASGAAQALEAARQRFTGRWLAMCVAGMLIVAGLSAGAMWWLMQESRVELAQLRMAREQLAGEVAGLKIERTALEADGQQLRERIEAFATGKGAGLVAGRCQVRNVGWRLCVKVDPAAGKFGSKAEGEFMVVAR